MEGERNDTGGGIETSTATETETTPLIDPPPQLTMKNSDRHVKTKVPEVEIHLYKEGKGPIAVFTSALTGWEQDQLDVGDVLEKYGLKSVFAYNPVSGRGAPIRLNRVNGRSLLSYRDGSVIYIDGQPKDSLIKPVTKILVGVAMITVAIAFVVKENPQWIQKSNIFGGSFSPWILACAVIVFTRMRTRTRSFLRKYGW